MSRGITETPGLYPGLFLVDSRPAMNRRERAALDSAEQPLALLRPTRSSETLIFLPTYNECDTIGRMIDALLALPIAGDVLVVDDRRPTARPAFSCRAPPPSRAWR